MPGICSQFTKKRHLPGIGIYKVKISAVKILSDENISPRIVLFLRDKGFDVLDTKEQNWFGKPDTFLLAQSLEQKRFILTQDSDFGTMIINEGKSFHGIIYLRLKSQKFENVAKVLDRLISMDFDIYPMQILVVTEEKIRLRIVKH